MLRMRAPAGLVIILSLALSVQSVFPQSAAPQNVPQKKDPRDLVLRIKNASISELQKHSFLELNFLKNSIYASKGYKFADDRPWLTEFFCSQSYNKIKGKKTAINKQEVSWRESMKNQTQWDLSLYEFPPCKESVNIDEDQMRALANLRVALFRKINLMGDIETIEKTIGWEEDPAGGLSLFNDKIWILGKTITYDEWAWTIARANPYISILREAQGYLLMLQIIKKPAKNFDAMELLGLYAGDVIFLKNIIEAQYGKPFDKISAWEIRQLTGVKEQKGEYDPKKLPLEVQTKLQLLDDIVRKIMSSDLNDIPSSLKEKPIEFLSSYSAAC